MGSEGPWQSGPMCSAGLLAGKELAIQSRGAWMWRYPCAVCANHLCQVALWGQVNLWNFLLLLVP